MMNLQDLDLYNAIMTERKAEILNEIRLHTLLKGSRPAGTRRRALLALIGFALLAIAAIATGAQLFA